MYAYKHFGAANVMKAGIECIERLLDRLIEYVVDVGVHVLFAVLFGDGRVGAVGNELDIYGLIESLSRDLEREIEHGLEVLLFVLEHGLETSRH